MSTLYLDFEYEKELRACRITGVVLGTLREEEYLVAEVDPPLPGRYLDRDEPIRQMVLAISRGMWKGPDASLLNRYFHSDEGIQEVIAALQQGDIPEALRSTVIPVTCVLSSEPVLKKKVDERRLRKIGAGGLHTDPDVLRPKRKPPGFWSFLWWRIRDCLEDLGLFPGRR